MGYTKGQKVTLSNADAFSSADAKQRTRTVGGTYYIWSAATKNGRIRICRNKTEAGKNPASKYVVCWVRTTAIQTGASSSKAATAAKAATKKTGTKKAATATNKVKTNIVEASDVTPTKEAAGQIGYLGKVLFLVRSDKVLTIDQFSLTESARYVEQERHLKPPTVEFTGVNAAKIKIDVELSAYLGTSPMSSHAQLVKYMKGGYALPLKLGEKTYGTYRWCITDLTFTGERTDKKGNWAAAKETISLVSVEKKG